MTTTEALTAAKNRLYLEGSTDFDTELTDFFDTAVDRLYPSVMKEVAPETITATVDDYGEATVELSTLTTPLDDVRMVEATQGQHWYSADNIFRHATSLRVRGLENTVTQLKLYGLKKYVVSGSSVDLPEYWELPVIWYMMSEFYDMLAGNKSKFNVYTQQSGGNAVDDMRSEAEYYESKAERYISDKAQLYGS